MSPRVTFSLPISMSPTKQLVPLAHAAEEWGFDAVALPDSVFFPETASAEYPYSKDGERFWGPDKPFIDPFLAFASMAAVTETLGFYTNVYKLPLRNPLLVAKEVSSLAVLTDNRFSLGVGLAWIPEEFDYTGTEKSTRGKRVDEAIDIIHAVCAGGPPQWTEYHGDHYDFDNVMISPVPDRPVPILVGGHSEPALTRAAQRCDGWISAQSTFEDLEAAAARLSTLLDEAERGDQPFEMKVLCTEAHDLDSFQRVAAIPGVTDIQVAPWYFYGGKTNETQVRVDAIERFHEQVIDRMD